MGMVLIRVRPRMFSILATASAYQIFPVVVATLWANTALQIICGRARVIECRRSCFSQFECHSYISLDVEESCQSLLLSVLLVSLLVLMVSLCVELVLVLLLVRLVLLWFELLLVLLVLLFSLFSLFLFLFLFMLQVLRGMGMVLIRVSCQ
jgi:hypothetical protein